MVLPVEFLKATMMELGLFKETEVIKPIARSLDEEPQLQRPPVAGLPELAWELTAVKLPIVLYPAVVPAPAADIFHPDGNAAVADVPSKSKFWVIAEVPEMLIWDQDKPGIIKRNIEEKTTNSHLVRVFWQLMGVFLS